MVGRARCCIVAAETHLVDELREHRVEPEDQEAEQRRWQHDGPHRLRQVAGARRPGRKQQLLTLTADRAVLGMRRLRG